MSPSAMADMVPAVLARATSLLLVTLLVLASGSARADEAEDLEANRRASALSESTLSPFCPGRTLASCPSGKATAWRADIRAWVAEGLTDEQILERLQKRVPDFQLSGTPETEWSWFGPLLVFAALTLLFVVGGMRSVGRRPTAASTSTENSPQELDPDRQALARELERFDE